jgi:1D-myo-inositol 3-kinase
VPNAIEQSMLIDFLAIGTVSRDIATADPTTSDYELGGTVSFAAVTASRLGRRPVVVTRAGDDVDLSVLRGLADVHVLRSEHTTTFANLYTPEGRVQYCYTPSPPIAASDIPHQLRAPHIALLGPLANEVLPEVAAIFDPNTIVAAVPQGWMRRWNSDGRVYPTPWTATAEILPHLDALILSIEDIDGELHLVDEFLEHISLVVLTEYRDGSTVYRRNAAAEIEAVPIPPRPAAELDPTGAGDIFATAFLLRLDETGDPLDAARYANITASFGVEGQGVTGIPTHADVLAFMSQHPWQHCG